jgi:outer membrane lipoprotein-sorting protein
MFLNGRTGSPQPKRMRSLILFFTIMIATSPAVLAQHEGLKPVSDPSAFRQHFSAAASAINTLRSDFVQEKKLSLLSERIRSNGSFMFKRPDKVRMEYVKPFPYLMIINKDKVYVKDNGRENVINAGSSKIFQQVNAVMMQSMNGTLLSNPDFKSQVFEGTNAWLVELAPLNANLKKMFDRILIQLSKKDMTALRIELREPGGDETIITYSNRETNVEIADDLFRIR